MCQVIDTLGSSEVVRENTIKGVLAQIDQFKDRRKFPCETHVTGYIME